MAGVVHLSVTPDSSESFCGNSTGAISNWDGANCQECFDAYDAYIEYLEERADYAQ